MTAVTRNTEYDVVAVGGRAAGGMAETTWLGMPPHKLI